MSLALKNKIHVNSSRSIHHVEYPGGLSAHLIGYKQSLPASAAHSSGPRMTET